MGSDYVFFEYSVVNPHFTPLPTPTPDCNETHVDLVIPLEELSAGDPFSLTAGVCNVTGEELAGYPLVVMLRLYSQYWFAPE